jgi:AcrR family transcriptional regulator
MPEGKPSRPAKSWATAAPRAASMNSARGRSGSSPPRPRREDPRIQQTRQLVLGATLELMAEHGSSAITVERIAERSGVARSTIYRRWPDLPRLYFEAFRQLRSQRTHEPTGDPQIDLTNYISDTAAHLNDPTYFSIVVFLLANAGISEQYAQLHLELFNLASSRGAGVFQAGIDHGWIRPDTDIWEAADVVRAPLVYTRLAKHELIDVDVALRAVPGIIRAYGTPKAIARLDAADEATRGEAGRSARRSSRATPASRRR